MKITWDEVKRARNLKKHGVDFEVAQLVFDDQNLLSEHDRIEGQEFRWQTIGLANGLLLIVGHNYIDKEDEEIIRIITARRPTRKERKRYYED